MLCFRSGVSCLYKWFKEMFWNSFKPAFCFRRLFWASFRNCVCKYFLYVLQLLKFSFFGLVIISSLSLYSICCVFIFSRVNIRASFRDCVFKSFLILFLSVKQCCSGFGSFLFEFLFVSNLMFVFGILCFCVC